VIYDNLSLLEKVFKTAATQRYHTR